MRTRFLMTGCVALVYLTAVLIAQEDMPIKNQLSEHFERKLATNVKLDYLLFLPNEAKRKSSRRWPLLLFLHGAGERGKNLKLVARHGPPKIVADRPDFPFIVVSPQCPTNQSWSDDAVLALLQEVERRYPVDTNRVYLTGLSMGGFGAWSLGLKHPDLFAAVVPICGGGNSIWVLLSDPKKTTALKTLPVWAFHGAKDPAVSVEESKRMVAALHSIGNEAKLTIYPEALHDSWTETYHNPVLYDWLLDQNLKARRKK